MTVYTPPGLMQTGIEFETMRRELNQRFLSLGHELKRLDAFERGDHVFNVKHPRFGAKGDGLADDTTAIQAAITAATPGSSVTFFGTSGGGVVVFPAGVYLISDVITVPPMVSLRGAGKGLTVIECTTSGAQVAFGSRTVTNRGGQSSGFTINGDDVADNPWYVGLCVQRTFSDIAVVESAGDGCIVEAAQNCAFYGCDFEHSVDSNLVLDYGVGNCLFSRNEINRGGRYQVEFRQSGSSPSGAFTVPTNNIFVKNMIERSESTTLGTVYHGAGRFNTFIGCDLSRTGETATKDMVVMEKAGSGASTFLRFDNCSFSGSATYTRVFNVTGAVTLVLTGVNVFENHSVVYYIDDTAQLLLDSTNEPLASACDNVFVSNGGSKTFSQVCRKTLYGKYRGVGYSATADYTFETQVDGDSFAGWRLRSDGLMEWGPRTGTLDVTLGRQTAASVPGLALSGPLKVQGTNAALFAGTGAPTVGAADGSVYMQTDAGAAPTFWVRQNSAWEPVMSASTATAITASTTQTQGQQPLTAVANLVTTVANANDVVTLPTAVGGLLCEIYNAGANTLQIYPASGDAINGGSADASVTLASGSSVTYRAFDTTNWYSIA